jgi:ATP-binding cassette subfamily B protein
MVAKYYEKNYSIQFLRENCFINREGVSLLGISEAAEKIGLRTLGVNLTAEQLKNEARLPCIAHWYQNHFIVVYKVTKRKVHVADPAHGLIKYTHQEFEKSWLSNTKENNDKGVCLLLEPSPEFYTKEEEIVQKNGLSFLFSYFGAYKKHFLQLFLSLLFGTMVQLILPFITQSVVDTGINTQNLNFIYLALIAQLVLFASRMSVDFIRSRILLHISARINISIISDFLAKLMKLPAGFFDSKMTGDLIQRINDHERIENLISSQTLNILFSFFNIVIFGIVLAVYSFKILFIFTVGSVIYCIWILLFLKKRKELEYKRFSALSSHQSNILELIEGMHEIKLNNCERQKRWKWERIQAELFHINLKNLSVSQYQQSGSVFINETKNILITAMAATSVLQGEMTLGMMLAVQYIIGQLNSPVEQMISFFQDTQYAKISLGRLSEIHNMKDEETADKISSNQWSVNANININNLSFQYGGPHSELVLDNVTITIPQNKITAIVGASGSGKTTLLKLLLGFYMPVSGEIKINETHLHDFNYSWWRNKCGVVMQDGFIFSDTLAGNIAVSDEIIDKERLLYATTMANIHEFVQSLPLGYNTKIGKEGNGLSQGQKQRILIARAIYKNPDYVFFDEATNALDANNERKIMENLDVFFQGKTVIVVAHRLSTVKNADQIIVLDKGQVIESGTHKELTMNRGAYYNLVKNQLELGN